MTEHSDFPLQQGSVDWLCSIYAALNILYLRGELKSVNEASFKFAEILQRLADHNYNIRYYVTQGVDPENITDVLEISGISKIKDHQDHKNEFVGKYENAKAYLLYLCDVETNGIKYTHYTISTAKTPSGAHLLYDSCGFAELVPTGDGRFILGDKHVEINRAWKIPLNNAP